MKSNPVTVITLTGGRPESFRRCAQFLQRQRFDGAIQWVVVDDGFPPVEEPAARESDSVTLIHPLPGKLGEITLVQNLLVALDASSCDKLIFCEDDDWYSCWYVQWMSDVLDGAEMAGCSESVYYHVPTKQYRVLCHPGRSSLCHTGFCRERLPILRDLCLLGQSPFIDVPFWERHNGEIRCLRADPLCIGIKGMPGRRGIGMGHRPQDGDGWLKDADMKQLRAWIGDDVSLYA